jgi:YacP-like NYN domain-containing protein
VSRTFLIDAYNLMHAVPELEFDRGRFPASRRLIRRLASWAEGRRERVVLVFDGARPSELPSAGRLEVRFMDDRADDDLKLLLERPGSHTLVSADGEIVARARVLKQACLSPQAFWAGVRDASAVDLEAVERERPLPRSEVEHWLEIFGGEGVVKAEEARARKQARRAPKQKPIMPPEEVQDWLRYFGEEPS